VRSIEIRIAVLKCISLLLAITLALLKVSIVIKTTPIIDVFDTPSFFNFKITGGIRMPGITFIYSVLERYESIALFQTLVSSISWISLSQVIFKLKFNPYISFISSLLILMLGFSDQVVFLDGLMNAESLNVSFLVLFISACILFYTKKGTFYILLCIISMGLYASVKSINGISILVPATFFIFYLLKTNKLSNKFSNFVVIYTLFTGIFSAYLFTKIDATPIMNTSALINQRLWNVESWKGYTLQKGFPIEGRSTYLRFLNRNLGLAPDRAVSEQPDYKKWYSNGGDKFIVNFMLSHPDYLLFAPLALSVYSEKLDLSTSIWGGAARGVLNYEGVNEDLVIKWPGLKFFWNENRTLSYFFFSIFLTVIGVSLLYSKKLTHAQKEFNSFIALLLIFAFEISYLSWWFGSTPSDIGRHQFPFGVLIRVLFILSIMQISQLIFERLSVRTKPLN